MAVLFVDLVGCAHLCEELAPTEMNEVIESYFARFFDLVQEVGGSVNEIMGDGFMAIFEDESPEANTSHAVSAALKVLAVMDQDVPDRGRPEHAGSYRPPRRDRARRVHAVPCQALEALDLHRFGPCHEHRCSPLSAREAGRDCSVGGRNQACR